MKQDLLTHIKQLERQAGQNFNGNAEALFRRVHDLLHPIEESHFNLIEPVEVEQEQQEFRDENDKDIPSDLLPENHPLTPQLTDPALSYEDINDLHPDRIA